MIDQDKLSTSLQQVQKSKPIICIFGTGNIALNIGIRYLKYLDLNVDFFCDNDEKKWGQVINGIECLSPQQLKEKKNVFVFIMTSKCYEDQIQKRLKDIGISNYIGFDELQMSEYLLDSFFNYYCIENKREKENIEKVELHVPNNSRKKIAVYSCVLGGYDAALPIGEISPDCDYYLITDKKLDTGNWKCIDIEEIISERTMSNARKNRFCKIMGPELFWEYEYSIYIDGNIRIKKDISTYCDALENHSIAMFGFPVENVDCLYFHGMALADRKDDGRVIHNQLLRYFNEGFPKHFGLLECGVIVRKNNDTEVRKIMDDWWEELCENSYRDQLSLTYVLWKNGKTIDYVKKLGNNWRNAYELEAVPHLEN